MRIKKITGHKIFLDKLLGKGSYGKVNNIINFRFIKANLK